MSLATIRTELLTHYLFGVMDALTAIKNMAVPSEKDALLKEAIEILQQHPSLSSYASEHALLMLIGDK